MATKFWVNALIINIVCFFLQNGYSQSTIDLYSTKRLSVDYLNKYLDSDSCDYNLLLLLKHINYSSQLNDLNINLSSDLPRFSDNEIPFNFYSSVIGQSNKQYDDSLQKTYTLTKGIEHCMLWGANADKLEIDDEVLKLLNENTTNDAHIRTLCHIAISIDWAQKKMSTANNKIIEKYKNRYAQILIQQLDQMKEVNDDFMEGTIGLVCLGKKNKIKKKWVQMIVSSQNKDGGWSWDNKNETQSHPHTTIIGYWVIVELLSE